MCNKGCQYCYYGDVCAGYVVCEDYFPITDESIDVAIKELVEQERIEYYEAWDKYVTEHQA